jgi:hypothetical protein
MKKHYIFLFLGFLLFNNCSNILELDKYLDFKDIQNQINSAKDGDVVNIPAGTCIFKSQITINKNITIKGAGVDKTVFYNYQTDLYDSVLRVMNNDKPLRITGITFKGKGVSPNDSDKSEFIYWHNTSQAAPITGFRIDHCKFIDGGKHSITIWGAEDIFGVIDHCTFINASRACMNLYGAGTGAPDWDTHPQAIGTINAIFIEYCSFTYNKQNYPEGFCETVTGINGARYVYRYNTTSHIASLNANPVDMHGNWYADRGGYSAEIYDNTFNSGNSWYGIYIRGGRGVILDNTFNGLFYEPIIFANDGSFLPSASNPRDKTNPAIDQVNNFYINGNHITCAYYSLTNALISDGNPVDYVQNRGYERTVIQAGRDYFDNAIGGYAKYPAHPLDN